MALPVGDELEVRSAEDRELERALDLAYRHLNRRDRTVSEVRGHLERKGVEAATVERVVVALTEEGYLDDARYASRFANDRRRLDGWGAERIERRLVALGIERELARSVAARDREAELQSAIAVLRGRLRASARDARERDRALGLLLRRGYELELAHDAIRAHAAELV